MIQLGTLVVGANVEHAVAVRGERRVYSGERRVYSGEGRDLIEFGLNLAHWYRRRRP